MGNLPDKTLHGGLFNNRELCTGGNPFLVAQEKMFPHLCLSFKGLKVLLSNKSKYSIQ
jgi:hypothetical protein